MVRHGHRAHAAYVTQHPKVRSPGTFPGTARAWQGRAHAMVLELDLGQIANLAVSTGVSVYAYKLGRQHAKTEANISSIIGAIRSLISTLEDEGERRAIEAGFIVRNSPPKLQYDVLKSVVEQHGRPPESVIEAIRKIAADATLDESWKILGAIGNSFTSDALANAYGIHGGDAMTANRLFLAVIEECRELGTDVVLKKLGLIDE